MKLLVIDTETGGLDANVHSLLTYAGVIWEDGVIGETLGPVYVREPELVVTPEAMAVNKIDLDDASLGWLEPKAAVKPLHAFLRKHFPDARRFAPIAAHNAPFDLGFFGRLFRLAGEGRAPFDHRALDTMGILRFLVATGRLEERLFPDFKLQTAMKALGVTGADGGTEQRHDCLGDALIAARVLTECWKLGRSTVSTPAASPAAPTMAEVVAAVAPTVPRLSFSSLARVAACPASVALPRVESDSEWSERGTARHAYLADVPTLGEDAALARVPEEHREECAALVLDGLPLDPATYKQEIAVAYDVATGRARILGYDIGRAYAAHNLAPTEIPGSLDVVADLGNGIVYDGDFKGAHDSSLGRAKTNLQTAAGALAYGRAVYGADLEGAVVELIHLREDGTHWVDRAELDALDLAGTAQELRRLHAGAVAAVEAAAAGKPLDVHAGVHCTYCPAFYACPAQTALVRELAADATTALAVPAAAEILRPEELASAVRRLAAAKKVIAAADEQIKRIAAQAPIPLGDGRWYGPQVRKQLKSGVAIAVLLKEYGSEAAQAAMKPPSTSKEAVEAVIKAHAKATGQKAAPLVRRFMAQVEAADGFSETIMITEYKGEDVIAAAGSEGAQ